MPRFVYKVTVERKAIPLQGGGQAHLVVVELFLKNAPNIVFHGLGMGERHRSSNMLETILIPCEFSTYDIKEIFTHKKRVELERDVEAYYTKTDLTKVVSTIYKVLDDNLVQRPFATEILEKHLNAKRVRSLSMATFIPSNMNKKVTGEGTFKKAIRQLIKWGF